MAKAKPAASINARRKGKTGELEFAAEINHRLGGKFLERNLEQVRNGGHDLILNVREMNSDVGKKLNQLAFEIKRRKKINRADIRQWWNQTVNQSQRINKVPVLAFRQDRDNWNCLFPLSKTLNIKNPDNCVQMGIDLFVTLVKNPELKNDGCF